MVIELNFWTRTLCTAAQFDDKMGEWTVDVVRGGEHIKLRLKHLVLATGVSGKPNVP